MQTQKSNTFYNIRYNELLTRIPLNAKVILEIGCEDGLLGFEYKKRNPEAKYIGVESSLNYREIAVDRLDTVIICDVDDYSTLLDKFQKVDCLIFNNVFQYIRQPIQLLNCLSEILNEDSIVITLFSNPNHWSFLKNYFNGETFSDNDLLIQDYFHKLTPDNIRSIFRKTSFKLFDIIALTSISEKQNCKRFIDKIDKSIFDTEINKEQFISRVTPSYYIARAGYNNNIQQEINILIGEMDVKGVSESRMILPYKLMSSDVRLNINISDTIVLNNNSDYPKIFLFYRPIHTRNDNDINKIKRLINQNYLVIIDYDDDPNIISTIHPEFTDWNFTFKSAHGIQTTNNYLANYLKTFNPEVNVFKNSVPRIGEAKGPFVSPYLRIFFGAINRKNDWIPWIETLNNITQKYPNKLFFDVVHDLNFYNSLKIPENQKRFTTTCDYSKYLQIMKGCDICFLPLNNNHFNNCKSDLKAVEAASFGLALLASPVVYRDNFSNGINASFFEDINSLTNILTDWINDPIKVGLIGRSAQKYVLNNRLFCYQIDERRNWYQDLWERKDDLTKAIYIRESSAFNS